MTAGGDALTLFVITAPGLEAVTAAELAELGLAPHDQETGGLAVTSDLLGVWRANLHLRTASRVLVRLAAFHAAHFNQLEKEAAQLPWPLWIAPGARVTFRTTSRKSRLYHQKAIAERLGSALRGAVQGIEVLARAGDEDDDADEAQQIHVRVAYDQVTLSVDSTGALLHRRGYRQAVAKAPLRETLAAAMLRGVPWEPATALADPLCGSGTIPIEAALMARRIPPGLHRRFAFERWPDFDRAAWSALRRDAEQAILPAAPAPIAAADRDAGAVRATRDNAERAGVAGDVEVRQGALSAFTPPAPTGLLLTNPPYGFRIGDNDRLRDLYAELGHLIRGRLAGWRLGFLSAVPALERQAGAALEPRWQAPNGGIRVRFVVSAPTAGSIGQISRGRNSA